MIPSLHFSCLHKGCYWSERGLSTSHCIEMLTMFYKGGNYCPKSFDLFLTSVDARPNAGASIEMFSSINKSYWISLKLSSRSETQHTTKCYWTHWTATWHEQASMIKRSKLKHKVTLQECENLDHYSPCISSYRLKKQQSHCDQQKKMTWHSIKGKLNTVG